MHAAAYAWLRTTINRLPRPTRVIEFGSRDINGTPRALIPKGIPYIGVDLVDGPGVDVQINAVDYHTDAKADLVLCCEVLEHAFDAPALVRHALECTAPGGHLLITCATIGRAPHSAVDGGPLRPGEFYRNVTVKDLALWLSAWIPLTMETRNGDLYALAEVPDSEDDGA